jgi:hypothetical protein
MERAMGIEPTSEAWEASILPLYDARSFLALSDYTQLSYLSARLAFPASFNFIRLAAAGRVRNTTRIMSTVEVCVGFRSTSRIRKANDPKGRRLTSPRNLVRPALKSFGFTNRLAASARQLIDAPTCRSEKLVLGPLLGRRPCRSVGFSALGVDERQENFCVKRKSPSGLLSRSAQGDIHAPIIG